MHIYEPYLEYFESLHFIFFEMDGIPVPWQVNAWKTQPISAVNLEAFSDPESAVLVTGKPIYAEITDLPEVALEPNTEDDLLYSFVKGFQAVLQDEVDRILGEVMDVEQYPNQEMAIIRISDDHQKLIPLVDAYIHQIDEGAKKIVFDLPKGFLDL